MIATTNTKQTPNTARLTLQTVEIAPETTAIRCLDWDRDRFDIELAYKTVQPTILLLFRVKN